MQVYAGNRRSETSTTTTLASVDHTTKALHSASFFRLTEADMSRAETSCSPQSLMRTSRISSSLICSTLSASCGCEVGSVNWILSVCDQDTVTFANFISWFYFFQLLRNSSVQVSCHNNIPGLKVLR